MPWPKWLTAGGSGAGSSYSRTTSDGGWPPRQVAVKRAVLRTTHPSWLAMSRGRHRFAKPSSVPLIHARSGVPRTMSGGSTVPRRYAVRVRDEEGETVADVGSGVVVAMGVLRSDVLSHDLDRLPSLRAELAVVQCRPPDGHPVPRLGEGQRVGQDVESQHALVPGRPRHLALDLAGDRVRARGHASPPRRTDSSTIPRDTMSSVDLSRRSSMSAI